MGVTYIEQNFYRKYSVLIFLGRILFMRASLVNTSIHIFINIVIYKCIFYSIVMMGFRKMSINLYESVSL